MFTSARLKLTAWYLLIIMGISISFSVVIYQVLNREVERFARGQRIRMERIYRDAVIGQLIPPDSRIDILAPPYDPDLIAETSRHILLMLIIVDGIIFVVSGCLGYMLAGQTLAPIKLMMDEQNRFISDSSHELRTPLTALKSTMEVNLRDTHLTLADARTVMKESIEEVNKLQSLSDALLQLAQYDTSNGKSVSGRVPLSDVLTEAVKKIKPMAGKKHITVRVDPVRATVQGDPYGLTELFVILLDNAIKYSGNGKTVEIGVTENKSAVTCAVTDHGMGITETDIPHIFDRFYRADVARSKNAAPGYGLGLSIAKKITEMHKGSIEVTSSPGKGTVFTVRLPKTRSAEIQKDTV